MPDVSLLPYNAIRKAVKAATDDQRAIALQYGGTDGRVQTRQVFCDLMRDIGIRCKPDQVLITTGAQEALALIAETFINPGDIILAEPGATVGFAGARVIEQTTRKALPKGFQQSEFLLTHGFVDAIVPRQKQKAAVARLLRLHCGGDRK